MEKQLIMAINAALPNIPVYWGFANDAAQAPFIVLQWVGGAGYLFMDYQTSGGFERRLQVAAWAETYVAANEYIRAIQEALLRLPVVSAIDAPIDTYDYEMSVYGSHMDFTVIT